MLDMLSSAVEVLTPGLAVGLLVAGILGYQYRGPVVATVQAESYWLGLGGTGLVVGWVIEPTASALLTQVTEAVPF